MAQINVRIITQGMVPEHETLTAQDCPFCGNDGGLDIVQVPNSLGMWSVVCPGCHGKGPLEPDVTSAIVKWNVRAGEPLTK